MTQTMLTAILAAGVVAGGVVWLIRAVVASDFRRIGESLIRAEGAVSRLTEAMQTAEHAARDDRREMHGAVEAIRQMLHDHELRISRAEITLETIK